jgi:hypothetical protein
MRTKKVLVILILFITNFNAFSQESSGLSQIDSLTTVVTNLTDQVDKLNRLKITGYLQPQFQLAESEGAASFAAGNFAPFQNSRIMLRRGRVKFTYENGPALYMLNTDWTEKGVNIREAYGKYTLPAVPQIQISTGMRQYLFGHDVGYSSGDRETPERARMFQTLFPTERDMQAIVTFQPLKTSLYNIYKVDIGVSNGSGVAAEFDKFKDFYGRFSINKSNLSESVKIGVGISYLKGGYRRGQLKYNTIGANDKGETVFITKSDSSNLTAKAPRNYFGLDFQLSAETPLGINVIRAEYITGVQTGTGVSSTSPNLLQTAELFQRNFSGLSVYFIQNIMQSKHQLILKYDYYDPNVKLANKQIGIKGSNTNAADIKYTTIGFGWNIRLMENTKVTFYYDKVLNEATSLAKYTSDLKDSIFTLRWQYKF